MHVVAARAVALGEAREPEFKSCAAAVVKNAQVLVAGLIKGGLDIVTGGTDTHGMLVDLRPKKVTGNQTETALGRANITCNKNAIPFDPEKPIVTAGIRLGECGGRNPDQGRSPGALRALPALSRTLTGIRPALWPADSGT